MGDRQLIDEAKGHIGFKKALREEQYLCLEAVMSGQDVLAVLPTGFGKSLIYQLVPFVMSLKNGIPFTNIKYCIVVITPLNSIMTDQCTALSAQGISSCAIDFMCHQAETFNTDSGSDSDQDDEDGRLTFTVPLNDIEKGLFRIVYAHPEALLKTKHGYDFMGRLARSGNLVGIAIDEAHMILEWGGEFRKEFSKIGTELLSRFPQVPAIVLTATAPPAAQQELIKSLKLKQPKVIAVNPDRPNIKYKKILRPASTDTEDHLEEILTTILDQLMTDKLKYPLTIMYTDTSVISFAYSFFENKMGKNQYVGANIPENRLFAQYQQVYTENMKKFIVQELCKEESRIRIVFATVALGMGLNAPHIRQIIHYKPPTSLEKYFQETGRAGRDGLQSTAVLYYNNTDIRKNRPGIEKNIITYCQNTSRCYRAIMLEYFGYTTSENVEKGFCCDFCDSLS